MVAIPTCLLINHPIQCSTQLFDECYNEVEFYYNMMGPIDNHQIKYEEEHVQDRFIYHLQNKKQILEHVQ